jgi:hypothetical protein
MSISQKIMSYFASETESSGASRPTAPLHLYGADKISFVFSSSILWNGS